MIILFLPLRDDTSVCLSFSPLAAAVLLLFKHMKVVIFILTHTLLNFGTLARLIMLEILSLDFGTSHLLISNYLFGHPYEISSPIFLGGQVQKMMQLHPHGTK